MSTIRRSRSQKLACPKRGRTYTRAPIQVAEYHTMLTSGILHPDERGNFYGWIVKKMGHNPPSLLLFSLSLSLSSHSSTVTHYAFLLQHSG
jgi:hypothetical protein